MPNVILEVDDLIYDKVSLYANNIDQRYKKIYNYRDMANDALTILKKVDTVAGSLKPYRVEFPVWRDQLETVNFCTPCSTYYQISSKDVPKLFTSVDELVWRVRWAYFWIHLAKVIELVYVKPYLQWRFQWSNMWAVLGGIINGSINSCYQLDL